ncbi:NAD(P)-dependent alcohol dehydrogenase [Aspergillus clavatus NRRL 1]|uniref:Alcohol dehydrogenase n=1 Tax=Aspergillus clavatus (strain ATCC 1007 / CBS 513.65 / DSM 816 / NCTC 3887 / NRRL 1 / QM 1276 / 107) TaxID=344612 RepID=A1CIX6_ASPCL|nr:alcohol dehydrogenase [Aspergillus clavatus NRRL 1]EAW10831.1 alcohol dehydrogenase [Aspergillus clavatus NRRL 1]
MTIPVTAYKGSSGGQIVEWKTEKDTNLTGDQVLIQVTHSGVCFTDVHYMQADMVLGHEGAGVVLAVGPEAKTLRVGDSVGWGYEHDCCGHCRECLTGWETLCSERKFYAESDFDQGSFATHAVWREAFVFKIPTGLDRADAAPLMCGGSTAWNGLRAAGVTPTSRVGIIGIGGLGHFAIQFAAKMGCQVVAFSRSNDKREEALALGAREYYATKDGQKLDIGQPLDQLIVTTSVQPNWEQFVPIMAPGGTIVPISIDMQNLIIPYLPVVVRGLRIQGAIMSSRQVHREMLDFAALHGIKPVRMNFPLNKDGVEEALRILKSGGMKYRGVLVAEQ